MKIVFAGPSLYGEAENGALRRAPDIAFPGPAAQGDLAKAVLDGATAIGLIDGRYEDVASPWHKEILFALSNGVAVLGAASLGALRAAECSAFGMVGVGQIFERYRSGELVDDCAVAQLHAPAELGYLPLTEALVNVEATLRNLVAEGDLDREVAARLDAVAKRIFFKELTFEAVLDQSDIGAPAIAALRPTIARRRIDLKRLDALRLVDVIVALPDVRQSRNCDWRMATPPIWTRFIHTLETTHSASLSGQR